MRGPLLLLIGLLALGPAQARADGLKLRISLQQSIKQHLGQNLVRFKDEVEARSGGAIAVEIYDDSKLYSDNEAAGAVASGAIEMASITYQQLTRQVPAIGIFEQPFLFNSEALVRAAVHPDSEMRRLLDQAVLEATGVRVLWWQSYGFSVFFSKARDVRHPSSIRNQRIRVFGDNMSTFVRYCGGEGLVISASKQVQALKDGTADMIMSGITTLEARQLWTVTDTVTRTEHAALEFLVIIGEKLWQSLGERERSIIVASARKVEQELRDQMAEVEEKTYALALSKGMKLYNTTPNDVAEWRACSADLLIDYMAEAGELGSRLMAAYGRLRTQPCCSAGPAGVFSLR